MGRILIVDDEQHLRRILASALSRDNHNLTEASGVAEARKLLAGSDFDAVITDHKMADGEGLQVLASARENDPALSVVMLTAVATIELAVESMRQGAFDFVTKPFQPETISAAANRACEHTRLLRENGILRETVGRLQGSPEIIGKSQAIQEIRKMIARVAPTNVSVLILGETGTGKELVARALHAMRQPRPQADPYAGRVPGIAGTGRGRGGRPARGDGALDLRRTQRLAAFHLDLGAGVPRQPPRGRPGGGVGVAGVRAAGP